MTSGKPSGAIFRRFLALLFGFFELSGGWFTLELVHDGTLLPPPHVHPNSKDLVELESEEGDEGMDKMWVGVKAMGFSLDEIARWMKVGSDDVFGIV